MNAARRAAARSAPVPVLLAALSLASLAPGIPASASASAAGTLPASTNDTGHRTTAARASVGASSAASSAGTAALSSDVPRPPPPDLGRLPDGSPNALPGVRQVYRCTTADHAPNRSTLPQRLWGQRLLRLPALWRASRGREVRIAVIDTGVSRHPLLGDRLVDGGDFVAGADGVGDCDGHGTAVAGIAAGSVDAGTSFAGVAPEARVIAIRQSSIMFSDNADGARDASAGNLLSLARAVVRATDLNADVVNISIVACQPPGVPGSAELRAAIHRAVLKDVVVVAAAGNTDGRDACPRGPGTVVYPGWFDDDVLTVASVGPSGLASEFSRPGPWVDVAAPGERLVSLAAGGAGLTDTLQANSRIGPVSGTSFAAPAVAGLAALIRARFPELTAAQVIDRITATAAGSGRTDSVGYGTVDPVAALTRMPEVLPPPGGAAGGRDTGLLELRPGPRPTPVGPGALWGGGLALLATVAAGGLAVTKRRDGWRDPR